MTDWTSLNQAAAPFTSLTSALDPVSNTMSVTFAGLQVKLSDVLAAAEGQTLYSVTIFADTLTVDTPTVTAEGLVVVARSLDLSGLTSPQIAFVAPSGGAAAAELLIGAAIGGAPALTQAAPFDGAAPQPIPVGTDPMQALLFTLAPGKAGVGQVLGDAATLQDLAGRSWALNSLQCSYTAAANLMDSTSASDRAVAQSMFGWIVSMVGALGLGGAKIPSDFLEIYNQAGALLVTMNVAPGGYFVPVLSADLYQSGVDSLISALAGYETSLNTLAVETDIAKALAEVSGTLQDTSQAEIAPLQLQLSDLNANISALYTAIIVLRSDFILQAQQAGTDFKTLELACSLQDLAQFTEDCLNLATSVVSLGVNVAKGSEGDVGAVSDGMKSLLEGYHSAAAVINDLTYSPPAGGDLPQQAIKIMQMQVALMTSFQTAVILQSQTGGDSADPLPSSLQVVQIDPGLAWDNYMISAEAVLTSVKEAIGNGDNAEAAQDAANNYLASLKILAGYGKAIDGKFTAYSSQVSQASIVTAQITAAQNVVARWQQQEAQAKSDEEKLAILRGVLEARANALKRSIYVAWTYYEAAYFYVHLVAPPVTISLSMSSAQLKDAFASVSTWIAQLLGTAPDGQHVVLPNTNVSISFDFPIRTAGSTAVTIDPGDDVALLTPAAGGKGATLTWSIPMGDAQLEGVLPQDGDVAIWITALSLSVDGVATGAKGNVIVSVATSGTYENGFGADDVYDFFGPGLVGDYAYNTETGATYIPWQIPTAVYMTPTPFTQWTLTFDPTAGDDPSNATMLHLNLTAAYMENPQAAAVARKGRRRRSLRRATLKSRPRVRARAPVS